MSLDHEPCHTTGSQLSSQQVNRVTLYSLPPETIHAIVRHLPINSNLTKVGLSCTLLATAIFSNLASARQHFKYLLNLFGESSMWTFLDAYNIKFNGYLSLPFNYQTAIYGEILLYPEWEGIKTWTGNDMNLNLMWYLRWELPQLRTLKIIKRLLQTAYFDPTKENNRTVRFAARLGHLDIVRLLVESNPKIDVSDRHNYAIYCSAATGSLEMVEYLLRHPKVDPSAEDNLAIQYAIQYNHIDVARRLLQDPRVNPSRRNNMCIRSACDNGRYELVELLMSDDRVDPSDLDNICIIQACEKGYDTIIRLLLTDERVDPAVRGDLPLREAAEFGNTRVVEILMNDSRVNPGALRNRPLRLACTNGHSEIVNLLLKDPRVDPAVGDSHLVWLAAGRGHLDIVRILMQYPTVDPSVDDNKALVLAQDSGHLEIVDLLMTDPRVQAKSKSKTLNDME
ncbi:UNVERIFIED_CONTAM: hypothetical protein HDU68_011450 [Siphonaria sp. JEL0065]|nr:hypothetical protein HDU68_011450 [Siphonaria sp. JEL0065]